MVTATGIYFIKIDAKSGNVVSITQEEKAESTLTEEKTKKLLTENEVLEKISSQGEVNSIEYIQDKKSSYYQAIVEKGNEELTLTIDPFTGGITHSAKTSLRLLNESDAVDLALKRVNWDVDDIDFIERDDQTPYYLIEVETNDDREAVVQIDAYKREVITFTWEDENEGDSD